MLLYLTTELLLRIGLSFLGYSFWKPSDRILTNYYPQLTDIVTQPISKQDAKKDILILGGSVVSTPWSHLEQRLDTLLRPAFPTGTEFQFYNVAAAGHTSADNLQKYKLLTDQRFDLVIYYEAINENRANNIPAEFFRSDYSHMKWYNDLNLLLSHTEINITVLPYVVHLISQRIGDKWSGKVYIDHENVDMVYKKYGGNIKTASSFRNNLAGIIELAQHRDEKLLLLSYASYFPEGVALTGEEADMQHFAGCNYASPVSIWGEAEYVAKGIQVHNNELRKLVTQYHPFYLDLEKKMPREPSFFCDVCHLNEPGAQYFSRQLAEHIIDQGLLK
ncbi:hypothetical protein GCM10027275_32300 [Rhabdobacter roseus]